MNFLETPAGREALELWAINAAVALHSPACTDPPVARLAAYYTVVETLEHRIPTIEEAHTALGLSSDAPELRDWDSVFDAAEDLLRARTLALLEGR